MKLKTVSQAFQLFVVITSVIVQYYWFIENKSPIQLFNETKSRIINEFLYKNTSDSIPKIPSNTESDDHIISPMDDSNKKPVTTDSNINPQSNDPLSSNLILYEFEESLKYFKYNQYQQKSTMYLQFWTLFFETLSNNYQNEIQRNKDITELIYSFMHCLYTFY